MQGYCLKGSPLEGHATFRLMQSRGISFFKTSGLTTKPRAFQWGQFSTYTRPTSTPNHKPLEGRTDYGKYFMVQLPRTSQWLAHSNLWEVIIITPSLEKQDARTEKKSEGPELFYIIGCTLSIFLPYTPLASPILTKRLGSPRSFWSCFHVAYAFRSIHYFNHDKVLRI